MRALLKLSFCLLILSATGCVPIKDQVSYGHKYSRDALAFLYRPGTTREEVIATLGPPLASSADSRTILYAWEQTSQMAVLIPLSHPENQVIHGDAQNWGLFIAFTESGLIATHEIRPIGTGKLDEACAVWYRQKHLSP